MITLYCPSCQMKLKVPDELAGKKARCPQCRQTTNIPGAPRRRIPVEAAKLSIAEDTTVPPRPASFDEEAGGPKPPAPVDTVSERKAERNGAVEDEEPGETLEAAAHYEVEGEIARGGMGAIMRAVDQDICREVAVKFLLNHADAKMKARFVEEAQITGQLEHPNVVPIHQLGVHEDGRCFFSMKMVKGQSLAEILKQQNEPRASASGGDYTLGRLLNIFVSICNAMAYAHSREVIHRDLKPANVMVGDFGEVYVMDWGLAKVQGDHAESSEPDASARDSAKTLAGASGSATVTTTRAAVGDLTQAGAVLGTPAYMPPEQASAVGVVDQRSDIYSLGAILYEMMTLTPPVGRGGDMLAILVRVIEGQIDPPQKRAPERAKAGWIPPELSAIALKAMALKPANRYQTVETLRRDVELFLDGRSVSAKHDSVREIVWKLVKRNKAASVATGVGLLLLTVVLAVSFQFINAARLQAVDERGKAEVQRGNADEQRGIADEQRGKAEEQRGKAEQARQAAVVARQKAEGQKRELQRLSAGLLLDKGQALCEQDDVARGLLWFAKALEVAAPDDDDLQRVIRISLADWGRQVHPLRFPLMKRGTIMSAVYSPDGKTILAGGIDRMVHFWDAATGKETLPPLMHKNWVMVVAYSPDGQKILTGCADKSAALWDAASGKPLCEPLMHENQVVNVAFSRDGKKFFTLTLDDTLQVWNSELGEPLGDPIKHAVTVAAVAFRPDGAQIATGSADKFVRLWSTETGKLQGEPLAHSFSVRSLAYSHDGKVLASASSDKIIRLWDPRTRKKLGELQSTAGTAVSLAMRPGQPEVLVGGVEGAQLWSLATQKPVGSPLRNTGAVFAGTYHPQGKFLLTGSNDQAARLWDRQFLKQVGPSLQHQSEVSKVAFAPDGQSILTWTQNRSAFVWNPRYSDDVVTLALGGSSTSGSFSKDDTKILVAHGASAGFYDAITGKPLIKSIQHKATVVAALSPDEQTIVVACLDKTARCCNAKTGQPVGEVMTHDGPIRAVAFSLDGKIVATSSLDKTIRLWDADTGKPRGKPLLHRTAVLTVSFSPNGKTLVGADSYEARLWDVETGQPIGQAMTHKDAVYAAAFSPDGIKVLTGSYDTTARIWDAATGKPLSPPMQHGNSIVRVAYSPDGKLVATASLDRTARVWYADTGKPACPPLLHPRAVLAVAFSPDSKMLLTGGPDEKGRLWDIATGKPLGKPMPNEAATAGIAFSHDGTKALAGRKVWTVPKAISGEPKRLRLWVQVLTGFEIDPDGVVNVLDAAQWQERQGRLDKLGGRPLP